MRSLRWMTGVGLGAVVAAGIAVSPALQARESQDLKIKAQVPVAFPDGLGAFTPAAVDPKLAELLSRSRLSEGNFRFTPSESRGAATAAANAVRPRREAANRALASAGAPAQAVKVAPISYNLGASADWKRGNIASSPGVSAVTTLDLVPQAPGKDRVDLGVIDKARPVVRTTIGAKDRTIVSSQRLVTEEPGRAIDVGGSLSLTRNLNVTAGVRYRSERDRLPQLTNEGRDSQAVYVGTAFRF
ncbi:MAG: hypothetical protein ACOY45_13340 [Pseudomonadota bacterium]